MRDYDLAIAGAGPAGSVTALLAARSGRRVCLIEKNGFEKHRFGETAPPELRPELARLGLDHLTKPPFCKDSPAFTSLWGGDARVTRQHICSPWGMGLHLDRRAFDEGLAVAARDAGADLEMGNCRFSRRPGGGYDVALSNGGRARCQIAVLAGGRGGGRAGLPLRRKYLDNNVGIAAVFSNSSFSAPAAETLLEAIPSGWFYVATLPDGPVVVVFVTLAKFVPPAGECRLTWWLSALATTRMVREALGGYRIPRTVIVLDTRTSYADPCAGEDWFAIGDARLAHDPLSGRGLILSIHDACNAVDAMSRGYSDAVAAQLRVQARNDLRSYLRERVQVYRLESRFVGLPFWFENQRSVEREVVEANG